MRKLSVVLVALGGCADFDQALVQYCAAGGCDAGMAGGGSGASGGGTSSNGGGSSSSGGGTTSSGGGTASSGGGASAGGGGSASSGGGASAGGGSGASCTNGVRDGTETDVDCGGSCPGDCGLDGGCASASDCTSTFCHATLHRCAASACGDGVQNGLESDVDCGADCAGQACPVGLKCGLGADCATTYCDDVSRCALQRLDWAYGSTTLCQRAPVTAAVQGDAIYVTGLSFNCPGTVGGDPTLLMERFTLLNGWEEATGITLPARVGRVLLPGASGDLFALGGFSDSQTSTSGQTLRSGLAGPFTTVATMSVKRAYAAAGVLADGRFLAAGGHTDDITLATVPDGTSELFTYQNDAGAWTPGPAMRVPRTGAAGVAVGNELWVLGGTENLNGGRLLSSIESLPGDGGLSRLRATQLPSARAFFGAALGADRRLYFAGGLTDAGFSTTSMALDLTTGLWTNLGPLPDPRSHLALTLGPDWRLYAIGGYTPGSPIGASANVYTYGPTVALNPVGPPTDGGAFASGQGFATSASVQLRLGSPSGPLLATFATNGTGRLLPFSGGGAHFDVPDGGSGQWVYFIDNKSQYPVRARLP